MQKTLIITTVLLFGIQINAQLTKIDKLKKNISDAPNEKMKLEATLAFCEEWESFSPDTLYKYAQFAKQLAGSQKNTRSIILADYYIVAWLFQKNKLDTAFVLMENVLARYKSIVPYDGMYVKLYGLKGNILNRTAKADELMAHNFELIGLAEKNKDTLGVARGNIGIGNVNLKLKNYIEALVWYHKAFDLMRNPLIKGKLSFGYNNTAIAFYHLQNEDSAFYYIRQALKYSRDGENLTDLANSLFLYGGLLAEYKRLKEAEAGFREAIEVRKKIGDIYFLITDMGQLALFYTNTRETQKGIALCKEAIKLAEDNGPMYSNMSSLYEVLGRNYKAIGDFENYSACLYKMLELKDSIYKISTAEEMAEQQTRFEVQKKEATIANQKLKLIQRNIFIYGAAVVLIMAILLSWYFFKNYRRRQKIKMEAALKEEKKQSEFAVKEAEEKERKRIAADLHDNLGVQANAILYNAELLKQENVDKLELVGDLHNTAKEMLLNLRETLWAMKTKDIMASDLWLRIISFCQQMGRHYKTIKITTEGGVPATNLVLPSAKALNIVMMIQEAVSNAVKHANAEHIIVKSSITDKGWQLQITDDGKGFDMRESRIKQDSHGLHNMHERASITGVEFAIETESMRGTRIQIIIPT